ncbi:hypothetical protein C6500_18615 [Candidatus Poribacteria bacterium]|nr:MAG: hypothetical protein C6500_18615 [Candidatus Poribacteria bacterium]
MNTNKKSLLSLLALVMLFSCTPEPQQLVSKKNSVPTEVSASQKIKDATFCFAESGSIVGRCFLVAPNKVATNIHVIDNADSTSTYVRSRYATWSIRGVIAYDLKNDLVILNISGGDTPLPLEDSDTAQSGGTVSVVEYSGVMEHKVTEGVIHSVRNTDKWLRMKIDDLTQTITLDPKGFGAYCTRGIATSFLGKFKADQSNVREARRLYQAAMVDFTQGIQLEPENATVYNDRGWLKCRIGQFESEEGHESEAQRLYQIRFR